MQITSNVKYLVKLSADGYISSDDELVLDCNQFQCGGKVQTYPFPIFLKLPFQLATQHSNRS